METSMRMELINVAGFYPAVMSARSAMKSYDKCDTQGEIVGENDTELLSRLIKAGGPHCKCIRQIIAWFSVTAPRFWWQEMDTYRIGVEKGSESTMHKIHSRPLEYADFDAEDISEATLMELNTLISIYNRDRKPDMFHTLKRRLPESFLQKRYMMASYQALREIYNWRRNHRLKHWKIFCEWLELFPNSWIITLNNKNE